MICYPFICNQLSPPGYGFSPQHPSLPTPLTTLSRRLSQKGPHRELVMSPQPESPQQQDQSMRGKHALQHHSQDPQQKTVQMAPDQTLSIVPKPFPVVLSVNLHTHSSHTELSTIFQTYHTLYLGSFSFLCQEQSTNFIVRQNLIIPSQPPDLWPHLLLCSSLHKSLQNLLLTTLTTVPSINAYLSL